MHLPSRTSLVLFPICCHLVSGWSTSKTLLHTEPKYKLKLLSNCSMNTRVFPTTQARACGSGSWFQSQCPGYLHGTVASQGAVAAMCNYSCGFLGVQFYVFFSRFGCGNKSSVVLLF